MDLGAAIKSIRKQKGIKQNTFAELCDITQAYLSQIENNLKEPNLSTLKKIAEKLSIPLPILFFLSMDETDIPSDKKDAYSLIAPSVQSLLNQFFSSPN
ncbi:helix-turn-helix transcriptional regulator [Mucilaginibacter sp.]|uniref:helix-turn-helix domain-containing protein n=1 Tax=Mucilaginibacter sp. TaxID=1882438 RepID=UPI00260F2ED9|nr:helix-turn-helix transcriptional regulator [Mucilaginibacter sp.]